MNSQKSVKIKFSLLIALALGFLIALGAFFGVTFARADDDRTVTISGTSYFITSEEAKVYAHKDEEDFYTMFSFLNDKSSVDYRKNLAYKWIENTEKTEVSKDEDGNEEDTAVTFNKQDGWFNMEIGFADSNNTDGNIQFEKFVITFESQEYTQTKDGKSTNYIVFANDNNNLKVYIVHKEDKDKDLDAVLARLGEDSYIGTVGNDHITVNFTNYANGDYTVAVADENSTFTGKFENVGSTYSKYSSSTTKPVTPLSFNAVFATEEEDGDVEAHGNAFMTLYKLNNQSFKLKGASETTTPYSGGQVVDDTPPVLCLDKAVPFIEYNSEISFDYTVIDVLASSPSLVTSYYMLTDAYAESGTAPQYMTKSGGDYRAVSDSDDQYIFPHSYHYLPDPESDYDTSVYNEDFKVEAAIKVVLKLTDVSTTGQTTYVLLDWFVEDDYLLQIGEEGQKVSYMAVATDNQGLSYAYTDDATETSNPESAKWKALVAAYQAKVDEAAKDLKAGSKNYFYLPQLDNIEYTLEGDDTVYTGSLLSDNVTSYSDLTFSIYYNNGSQQSYTGKSSNELSINLTKAHTYVFTVCAKDAAGNGMYYYDKDNEKTDLDTGDVWNFYKQEKDSEYEGMKNYLPWFEFEVEESEISIEDPEEQSTAYVGSSFTPDSFEINGVSVKTVYTLYEFQNDLWAKDNGGVAMTFEEFSDRVDELLRDYRMYFTRIRPTTELKEGTADYDSFNDYGWNGSSLSFTPQTANAFYTIKCDASSSETAEPVTNYMTVAAAPKVRALKGEDTWVQDNITSIILLCIAGASLIGIVLLLVIKPKNKGDIDEVVTTPKKSKKK